MAITHCVVKSGQDIAKELLTAQLPFPEKMLEIEPRDKALMITVPSGSNADQKLQTLMKAQLRDFENNPRTHSSGRPVTVEDMLITDRQIDAPGGMQHRFYFQGDKDIVPALLDIGITERIATQIYKDLSHKAVGEITVGDGGKGGHW